jgi:two-component system sensor histidine kinase RpfC
MAGTETHNDGFLQRWWQRAVPRFKSMRSPEAEQALIRVGLAFGAWLYLALSNGAAGLIDLETVRIVATLYLIFSLAIVGRIVRCPSPSVSRHVTAMVVDVAVVTYALIAGGEVGAPLYGGYLWLVVGNGYRYGRMHLYAANTLSVAAFTLVLFTSDFWLDHRGLGVGLLIWLATVPQYVGVMLHRMDKAVVDANMADRAKSRFLANMSHELRTPLNAIIGYSELLQEEALERQDPAADDLGKIQAAGHHLLGLINEVLDLTKIESGKQEFTIEPFSVRALVDAVAATMAPLMRANRNTLQVDISQAVDDMDSDPTKLRQILLNLLSNAAKFTDGGVVHLGVSPMSRHSCPWIVFQVRDTGIGIEQADMERLFRPFSQLDASAARRYGGTGLGLVISKRLSELLGGQITVESVPGHGTTFTVQVPRSLPTDWRIGDFAPMTAPESQQILATTNTAGGGSCRGSC